MGLIQPTSLNILAWPAMPQCMEEWNVKMPSTNYTEAVSMASNATVHGRVESQETFTML